MGLQINLNAVNQAPSGACILQQSQAVNCICMVLKGKVTAKAKGVNITLGAGSFLGINDFYAGECLCDYVAMEEVTFYAFPIRENKGLQHILSANKDYGGLMVWAYSKYLCELESIFRETCRMATELESTIRQWYQRYLERNVEAGLSPRRLSLLEEAKPVDWKSELDQNKINYYKEAARLPLEIHKSYYLNSVVMSQIRVEEQAQVINTLITACREAAECLEDVFYHLINQGDQNLFLSVAELLLDQNQKEADTTELSAMLDDITDRINLTEAFLNDRLGCFVVVNRSRMEEVYFAVISGNFGSNEKEAEPTSEKLINEEELKQIRKLLSGSLQQIINFAGLPKEETDPFEAAVEAFVKLSDRFSSEDSVRRIKKEISTGFFDLYQAVFIQAEKATVLPMAVELFLNYAFVDERLVSPEHLAELCSLKMSEPSTPCEVYTIRQWLKLIYEGKKEPSRSEFDMTFEENLRDMKKRGLLSDEELKRYATDPKERLSYEIHSMFSYNGRLVNGQISTYVPILYSEALVWSPTKSYLSGKRINEVVSEILKKDPSIFYREALYHREELKIEKEYIMKQVFPDIIILPCSGIRAVMWQEITGKRRTSAGRFLFPMFFEGELIDTMIQTFGNFRWELCRTIQGLAWNNIQLKSLTSEYCDYLQYYRKNHELSEERKEKLKAQIQKAKGSSKGTFVQDYEIWMKYESSGAIRLNKVAREILATYCPFTADYRKALLSQPIFEDAMARFERTKSRKIYDLELHYRTLEKEIGSLPKELVETLQYYKNL